MPMTTHQPSIRCHHCGAPLHSRGELRVGGRTLQPFHAACYRAHAALQPWYRKPGWPINRWRSLLPFNALLLGVVAAVHFLVEPVPQPRLAGLGALFALANGWLLLARLVSYRTVERHLPRHERADASSSGKARVGADA